jgi:hypothetical protein
VVPALRDWPRELDPPAEPQAVSGLALLVPQLVALRAQFLGLGDKLLAATDDLARPLEHLVQLRIVFAFVRHTSALRLWEPQLARCDPDHHSMEGQRR